MAAAVLAIGLLGAACGSGGGGGGAYGGGGSTRTPSASGSASGGYQYGSGGGSSGSSGAAVGASVLTLTQVNFQFTPAKITVNQGDTITVSDTNPSTPHTFTIDGTSIDISNNGQQSQDVTIDLAAGTYTFYCRFHKAQGMQGTLVVK
jgi:plastocyanin